MGLSIKNRWFDEENRVYIVFTVDEVMELLNCKSQKAIKLIKELDCESGIGLIEKRRLGLGRPNVIYVKNFMILEEKNVERNPFENNMVEEYDEDKNVQNFENQNSEDLKIKSQDERESKIQNFENRNLGVVKIKSQDEKESKIQNFENQNSGVVKIETQEIRGSKDNSFEKQNSGMMKIKGQEFRKSNSNDTDINDIEQNDTIISNLSHIVICSDQMDMMETYRMIVKENVSYEALVHDGKPERQEVDELVELIVEVMMLPDDMTVRIGGAEKMAAVIKSRFMKLNMMHISYVLDCMRGNTTKINNKTEFVKGAFGQSI